MFRRRCGGQVVVADGVEFPTHRVVQRMRARVAPMPVQSVHGERRTRAGQFKQFVSHGDRQVRTQHFRRCHRDLRLSHARLIRCCHRRVDRHPRFVQIDDCQTHLVKQAWFNSAGCFDHEAHADLLARKDSG